MKKGVIVSLTRERTKEKMNLRQHHGGTDHGNVGREGGNQGFAHANKG